MRLSHVQQVIRAAAPGEVANDRRPLVRASRRGHYCASTVVVTYLLNGSALLDSWLLGAVWTNVVHNTQALAPSRPSLVRPSSASDTHVDPPGDPDRDTSSGVWLRIGFLQAHALVTVQRGSIDKGLSDCLVVEDLPPRDFPR